MKTTRDLPDELVHEIQLLAEHEGKELKDAVADLLRQALVAAAGSGSNLRADMDLLDRRREIPLRTNSGRGRSSRFKSRGRCSQSVGI